MNPFVFSLNSVAPILLMVLLGVMLKRLGVMDFDLTEKLSSLCFKVFIPLQIYRSIYMADFSSAFDLGLLAYGLAATAVVLVLLCLLVPRLIQNKKSAGAYIQGVYRGNIALIGLPLMQGLFGERGEEVISLLLALTILFYNVTATWVLTYYSGNGKPKLMPLLHKIATNPFIIATTLGLVTGLLKPPIPIFIQKTVSSLGTPGTPLALIALGATLKLSEIKASGLVALCATLLRQFFIPVLVLGSALLLGFRNEQLGALFCVFCSPAAAGSYVLAKHLNADHVLAGQILLMTTVFSFASMLLGITLLKTWGFI